MRQIIKSEHKQYWTRVLGGYLQLVVILQIVVYIQIYIGNHAFFYFDPRIGIPVLLEDILRIERYNSILIEWLSAIWICVLATLMILGKSIVKIYVVSELFLSIPNLIFIGIVIAMNMEPTHGFSIHELLYPIIVMLVATIVPLILVFMKIRK
jgi:hypothetical protein